MNIITSTNLSFQNEQRYLEGQWFENVYKHKKNLYVFKIT